MTIAVEEQYFLNVGIEIGTTEFDSFCSQRFSLASLVEVKRLKSATALVQFKLSLAAEGMETAKIEFRPAPAGQCILNFNPTYSRSGSPLDDKGSVISELLFCDFVLYLAQRGYIQGSTSSTDEARAGLLTELRELFSILPRSVAELIAKHQAERETLPTEGEPNLNTIMKHLVTWRQRIEKDNLEELVGTIKWYLEVYTPFPQLVASETGPRSKWKGTLQLAAPGRPRTKAYDIAYDFIKSGEKDLGEAFKWYCQNQGIAKPDRRIREAFRSAMKRRGIT